MTQLTPTLPRRMLDLPRIVKGGNEIPVPWFVAWVNGEPEFRAMDPVKFISAIKERLCWVCGQRMGVYVCFVAGPMCGINRTSSEPPSHADCARWSAINCPFLSNPRMVRREDELVNNTTLQQESAGFALSRNPGVTMLWHTRTYDVFQDGLGKPLITMGVPEFVEWYREGRKATRDEVAESIDSGLPALVALARQQKGAMEMLTKSVERFMRYLPEAEAEQHA